jgi:hypothetical protein
MLDIRNLPGYNSFIISWKFLSKAPEADSIRPYQGFYETFEKGLILAKIKKGDNFNRSNMLNISRIEI